LRSSSSVSGLGSLCELLLGLAKLVLQVLLLLHGFLLCHLHSLLVLTLIQLECFPQRLQLLLNALVGLLFFDLCRLLKLLELLDDLKALLLKHRGLISHQLLFVLQLVLCSVDVILCSSTLGGLPSHTFVVKRGVVSLARAHVALSASTFVSGEARHAATVLRTLIARFEASLLQIGRAQV
jgi:hypothetical protein